MENFKVDISDLSLHFPNISKPCIKGFFSLDENRKYKATTENLVYLYYEKYKTKVKFDLNNGYDKVVRKLQTSEKIDHLLQYVLQNVNKHCNQEKFLPYDFICFRGLLTELMCTPYNFKDNWTICAIAWKGNIYLCAFDTKEKQQQIARADEKQKRFCSWGYKFEQYMSTSIPGKQPDTNLPVYESKEFCCVFETKLENNKILYGAEMDAVDSNVTIEPSSLYNNTVKFVEFKTNRKIDSHRQGQNFRKFKLIKWWSQSFLVAIDEILCGFRTDSGIVTNITPFRVSDIPKQTQGLWNASACMNFCCKFLKHVKHITFKDSFELNPTTVWKFDYISSDQIIKSEKIIGASTYMFLPMWYIDAVNTLTSTSE